MNRWARTTPLVFKKVFEKLNKRLPWSVKIIKEFMIISLKIINTIPAIEKLIV